MIYLDNAATTQPLPEVMAVINESMKNDWLNPSSLYPPAYKVRKKVEAARTIIAEDIGVPPSEIYFTSSGSEANNMALQGFHKRYPNSHIIISNIEHKSIMECAKHLGNNVHIVHVDKDCCICKDELLDLLKKYSTQNCPALVSIQCANNETGVIQDMRNIADITHKNHAFLHTDGVQLFPHMFCNIHEIEDCDMMSVSGHKFGCPKGIGFLYCRKNCDIQPLIYGSQERNNRGGTENVHYILGLAKAVELRSSYLILFNVGIIWQLEKGLNELGCKINCENSPYGGVATIISCTLPKGSVGELLIYRLASKGIYVSAGSACNSKSNQPSYVLKAIGLTDDEIQRTIRISLGLNNTKEDVDTLLKEIEQYFIAERISYGEQ